METEMRYNFNLCRPIKQNVTMTPHDRHEVVLFISSVKAAILDSLTHLISYVTSIIKTNPMTLN